MDRVCFDGLSEVFTDCAIRRIGWVGCAHYFPVLGNGVFTFQNLSTVTVSFLHWQLHTPVSIAVVVVYFLGMLTGGSLVSLIKSWIRGSTKRPTP